MHATKLGAAFAIVVTSGVALKPPTYVPPTDEEKKDPEVRERLDRERTLIKEGDPGRDKLVKQVSESVTKVLDSFHLFAARAMFTEYFALMHEDGVFLGTDATERWTKAQFMDYARPFMIEQGRGWEYHPRDRHVHVSESGDIAWFDELLDNAKYGELRGSGVVARTGDGWKIMQYNLAFTVPNDKASGVVELIRAEPAGADD